MIVPILIDAFYGLVEQKLRSPFAWNMLFTKDDLSIYSLNHRSFIHSSTMSFVSRY